MNQSIIKTRKESFDRFYNLMKAQIEISLVNDTKEEQEKSFDYIESTLHALLDYWERIKISNEFSSDVKENVYAFRFANNVLKHAHTFNRSTIILKGHSYPIMFPLRFDKQYNWGTLQSFVIDKNKHDYPHYQLYLEGKEIRCTFKSIKDLLENN